jgi:hypothetical protein
MDRALKRTLAKMSTAPRQPWRKLLVVLTVANAFLGAKAVPVPARADPPLACRYTAEWTDGTRESADSLGPWDQPKAAPKLGHRDLFDPQRPLRWLVDNSLAPAPAPDAVVEFCGGDCLPGRVIGFRDGTENSRERLPPHLLVAASIRTAWPERLSHPEVRVTLPWLRRIVWQRVAQQYQPRTLFFPDGRQLEYRSIRFTDAGVQVLRQEGIREFTFGDLAELHLPAMDPWEAYVQQLAALGLESDTRLVYLETSSGLRATSTTARFQARPQQGRRQGPADQSARWLHLVQPPWSLEPLWLRFDAIRTRQYFLPHEVPLSRIEPVAARSQSDLGGVWPWQIDRNVEAGPLESAGVVFPSGFGVHAACELVFPLSPLVRSFSTRLGLDRLAADGGCVRAKVLADEGRGARDEGSGFRAQGSEPARLARPLAAGGTAEGSGFRAQGSEAPPSSLVPRRPTGSKTLYTSEPLIGSGKVLDTGRMPLEGTASGRLILQVEPAGAERPRGADPLDIRGVFNWLGPMVELDPEKLDAEVLRRGPMMVPAWQNWKVLSGDSEAVRLVSYWDRPGREDAAYRLMAVVGQQPLRLTGQLMVRPYRDRLLLAVSRPPSGRPGKMQLEVRVDGESLGRFDILARPAANSRPLVVSLARYHGQQVTVEVIHESQTERSAVDWEAISLVGRTAIRP